MMKKSDLEIKPEVFRGCFKACWIQKAECYRRKNTAPGESEQLSAVAYKLCRDLKQASSEPRLKRGPVVGSGEVPVRI